MQLSSGSAQASVSEPISFQWQWVSTEPFRARLRGVTKDLGSLPHDCSTRIALSGAIAPPCGYFESGTTAASWFPFLNDCDSQNVILIEQAIQLGRCRTAKPSVGEGVALKVICRSCSELFVVFGVSQGR
jgi:hypothetical protein